MDIKTDKIIEYSYMKLDSIWKKYYIRPMEQKLTGVFLISKFDKGIRKFKKLKNMIALNKALTGNENLKEYTRLILSIIDSRITAITMMKQNSMSKEILYSFDEITELVATGNSLINTSLDYAYSGGYKSKMIDKYKKKYL